MPNEAPKDQAITASVDDAHVRAPQREPHTVGMFRVDALRPVRLRATGYDIETEMLVKLARCGRI